MAAKSREPVYPVAFIPDETGYIQARFPDWPNIITGGETLAEAAAAAEEALAATVSYYQDEGLALPEPLDAHSGQMNVRVPRSLHRELKRRAMEEGVSLNALVTCLLAQALEPAEGADRPRRPAPRTAGPGGSGRSGRRRWRPSR